MERRTPTRVAVIGAGLIGKERIRALRRLADVEIAGVCDADSGARDQARALLGSDPPTPIFNDLDTLLQSGPQPDWFFVCLPHDAAVSTTLRLLSLDAPRPNILIEKPMGRNFYEASQLQAAAADSSDDSGSDSGGDSDRLYIGFNYRFFAGIRQALNDAREGVFGDLVSVDFVLGHGGYSGQEKSWKLDPVRAGGGCLIDPGIHLLDLCTLIRPFPQLQVVGGSTWSGFWNTGVEEDAHVLLRTHDDISISIHVSLLRWRSLCSMAIHGTEGYGVVEGRNRSYGPQTYRRGRRWGRRDEEELVLTSDGVDVFERETAALLFPHSISSQPWPPPATATEALDSMELLDEIRESIGLPVDTGVIK